MIRLAFVFVCVLGMVSPAAMASLVRKDARPMRERFPEEVLKPLVPATPKQEYRITEQTEVLLNGRPCRYEEVPADAVILRMEIASSTNKEIVKIHFRSATGPVKRSPTQAENRRIPAKKPIP